MKKIFTILLILSGLVGTAYAQCTVTSMPTNNCNYGDAIDSYVLNGVASVGNAGCQSLASGYTLFPNPVRTLTIGNTYTWSTTMGGVYQYAEGIAIWIDINNDQSFANAERLGFSATYGISASGSLTIPFTAVAANNIRMRVRCGNYLVPGAGQACTNGIGGYGETEDYYVNIVCPTGGSLNVAVSPSTLLCQGLSASITATGAQTYSITGGINNGVAFTPTATTTYTITGGMTACPNFTPTAVRTISVTSTPQTVSITPTPSLICAAQNATLAGTGGATNYTWSPGNSTLTSIIVSPSVTTVYTLTGRNGFGCPGTETVSLLVSPIPTITAVASPSAICNGGTTTITASGALTYSWLPINQTGSVVAVTPSVSTSYNVTGVNSSGCMSNINKVIIVNPNPSVNVSINPTLVCVGGPATLIASGGSHTYSWTPGGATASIIVNPSVTSTYSVTGTYTTTSCFKTVANVVSVFIPTLTVSPSTAICIGSFLNLSASGATSYTWDTGTQQQIFDNITVNPLTTSIYTVYASSTASNNVLACESSQTVQVTVNPNPTITAVADRTLMCKGESNTLTASGAVSYTWSASTISNSVSASIIITPTVPITITYSVAGKDGNNCSSSKGIQVKVDQCSGIGELQALTSKIKVYPNPSKGEVAIQSEFDVSLKITNELGQTVKNINLSGSNERKMVVKDLPDGIYFLTGLEGNQPVNIKIVVDK